MHVRTREDVEKENTLLRHQNKMLKLKYEMVNNALKQMKLLSEKEIEDFEARTNNKLGGANGHH
tara:strand:+ start:642 stop:833 length:192 start_codon:yes stop_codon:yes gene_type:complete